MLYLLSVEEAAHEHFRKGQLGLEAAADTETAFMKGIDFSERWYSFNEYDPPVNRIMLVRRPLSMEERGEDVEECRCGRQDCIAKYVFGLAYCDYNWEKQEIEIRYQNFSEYRGKPSEFRLIASMKKKDKMMHNIAMNDMVWKGGIS
jgi:hypothetical protein